MQIYAKAKEQSDFQPRMNTDSPSAAKPQPKWIVDG